MRWPRGEEWAAHLVRYSGGGRSSLEPRVGPHGGFVNDRGYEHVTCKTCGNVAVWPPPDHLPPGVVCLVPGHREIRGEDGVFRDTCPGPQR